MATSADCLLRAARRLALVGLVLWIPSSAFAQEERDLFSMSIEELLAVPVLVSYTSLDLAEAPASVTVITAEDIRLSPARNLYDLIEIYVPGGAWMNREIGPALGIRGAVTDRNDKVLLLVNGRLLNSRAQFGARSELEQWDLGDIQRIEVVRGPGSVTHGPGAVAGVISIVTHDATSGAPNRVEARYVDEYDARGASAYGSWSGDRVALYGFASVTRTTGTPAPQFVVDANDDLGYVGAVYEPDLAPLDYFVDYLDRPQVKLHLDARIADAWRLWGRYTQQGSTWRGNETKTDFGGVLLNQQGVQDRQWTLNLEHAYELGRGLTLANSVGAGSFDAARRVSAVRHPEPSHALNHRTDYAETKLTGRSRLNWRGSGGAELAAGVTYDHERFGAGWGQDAGQLRLGSGGEIVSGPTSEAIDPTSGGSADRNGNAVFVGDGWSANTFGFFGEAQFGLGPRMRALVSGRADKATDSGWLLSPRGALIWSLGRDRFVKLSAQRSHRLNAAAEVLVDARNGMDPDTESITQVELGLSQRSENRVGFDVAAFWQGQSILGWDGDANTVVPTGDLAVAGIEGALRVDHSRGRIGLSYALAKQLSWSLAPGRTRSGVSYADYVQPLGATGAVQLGEGNDLNNAATHAAKAYGRVSLFERLDVHVDARLSWGYEGRRDGLEGMERALAGYPEASDLATTRSVLDALDVYAEYDLRTDASVTYEVGRGLSTQIFVQNLLCTNGCKRYAYDTGNDDPAPRRVRFVEEPRVVGIRLGVEF